MLYYNKGIFDAYNANPANIEKVEYPQADWTYEEFYATAEKLTVRAGNAVSQFGCYSTIGWWGEWLTHVRQAGGKFMENGLVTLNTPQAIEGIQRYYDKMYSANRISNQKGIDDTFGDFSTKNYAMAYGGHMSNWADLRTVNDLDWDVQLLPAVNGNQTGGELSISALGIYKGSKSVEASWALIKYITRKRTLAEWNEYPYAPCRISGKQLLLEVPVAERKAPQNLEVVYESLEGGYCQSLPGEKYFSYVNTSIVQGYITKILEGEYTVEEGLREATERANNYIRQNYLT
jgi:ABC-type glycerol-3-phosphate transport system substrate-binding protein